MAKLIIDNTEITIVKVNGENYICLTDMLSAKDGNFFITDWLRNRNLKSATIIQYTIKGRFMSR